MRFALCLALLACGASVPKGSSADDVSGTYDFAVCSSEPCSMESADAYARGTIVLANEPLEFRYASTRLQARLGLDADQRNPRMNGCFALKTKRRADTVLGQIPAGGLDWQRKDGLIRFYLYQSGPEQAEYLAQTLIDGAGKLSGAGTWRLITRHISRDFLAGQRRGPPDAAACMPALEKRFEDER